MSQWRRILEGDANRVQPFFLVQACEELRGVQQGGMVQLLSGQGEEAAVRQRQPAFVLVPFRPLRDEAFREPRRLVEQELPLLVGQPAEGLRAQPGGFGEQGFQIGRMVLCLC
jgi:hypothetical protein